MPRSDSTRELIAIGRRFYARGWTLGTSGNFSVVESREPLRLRITASSVHKGQLRPADILLVDEQATVQGRSTRKPSAEALLHSAVVKSRGAPAGHAMVGAVLHTHSVWSTILSDVHAAAGGLRLSGFEMLKGLNGNGSHDVEEFVPILENDQDMQRLSLVARARLSEHPAAHALLLRNHGLYTWGRTLAEAERHVEILEFLFETIVRRASLDFREAAHGIRQDT